MPEVDPQIEIFKVGALNEVQEPAAGQERANKQGPLTEHMKAKNRLQTRKASQIAPEAMNALKNKIKPKKQAQVARSTSAKPVRQSGLFASRKGSESSVMAQRPTRNEPVEQKEKPKLVNN